MEPQVESHPVEQPTHATTKKQGPRGVRVTRLGVAVLGVAVALLAWNGYRTHEELTQLRGELSRRFAQGDGVARDAQVLSQKNQSSIDQLQVRLGGIDAKLQESQGQYSELESMYMEFSHARDDRSLSEIEQALTIASQQLQLAGNVPAAISALQAADNRLAIMDQARVLPLRKLISRDIDKLKALPLADVTSLALKLETLMGRIDALPLGFEHPVAAPKASAPAANPVRSGKNAKAGKKDAAPAATQSNPVVSTPESPNAFTGFFNDLWDDFRTLIRIERMDRPDPVLLAPTQAAYLRENVRLRLLSARLALLQRDGRMFGEDIRQARAWLERYFDTNAKPVADLLADLRNMENAQLSMALPSLEATSSALQSLKLSGKR